MGFGILIIGGSGHVGSALVRALLAAPECTELVMVNRRTVSLVDAKLRQVILDTAASSFESDIAALARSTHSAHDPLYGASCIGIGQGSQRWSDEDIRRL